MPITSTSSIKSEQTFKSSPLISGALFCTIKKSIKFYSKRTNETKIPSHQAKHISQLCKLITCSQPAKNSQSDSFGTRASELETQHAIELPHLKSPNASSQSTSPEQAKASAISVVIT